jgi:aspartyl-tRNA(Asn)/glutamyl-tRNA(Gln) amidotransferase subunit A
VGVVREHHFPDDGDPALASTFDAAVAALAGLGAEVVEVSLPLWSEMITADMITMGCEALAYHRGDLSGRWNDYFVGTRAMLATGATVSGADYVQAQRVRRVAQDAIAKLFRTVDVAVMPTAAAGAPTFDSLAGPDGVPDIGALFSTIFTPYWDSLGNPVLAVPMGFTAAGLPLSLQIAGPAFGEAALLRTGAAFQLVTDWHLREPSLVSAPVAA